MSDVGARVWVVETRHQRISIASVVVVKLTAHFVFVDRETVEREGDWMHVSGRIRSEEVFTTRKAALNGVRRQIDKAVAWHENAIAALRGNLPDLDKTPVPGHRGFYG